MSAESDYFDEQAMIELGRKTIEDLRKTGFPPTELKRLENVLRDGGVREALMLSSLLKTIRTRFRRRRHRENYCAALPDFGRMLPCLR